MATVAGTLYKTDGTPAKGGNEIQFRNRLTGAVITAPVNSEGQYAVGVSPPGTYDIGVNGDYSGNDPASVVVTTIPKHLDITSSHAR